jgi:hypothetical protein
VRTKLETSGESERREGRVVEMTGARLPRSFIDGAAISAHTGYSRVIELVPPPNSIDS